MRYERLAGRHREVLCRTQPSGTSIATFVNVSLLTGMTHRIYATGKMSRCWSTVLPIAILVLFLVGFPCRAMMMSLQAPAHHCCEDCGDTPRPQAPRSGCETLCVASGATALLQAADGAAPGVPVDIGLVELVATDAVFPAGFFVEDAVSLAVESPPLYLQHASLLI
jgi:hypothetical protein